MAQAIIFMSPEAYRSNLRGVLEAKCERVDVPGLPKYSGLKMYHIPRTGAVFIYNEESVAVFAGDTRKAVKMGHSRLERLSKIKLGKLQFKK